MKNFFLLLVLVVVVAVDMQAVMELQRWMMMGLCAAELQYKLAAEIQKPSAFSIQKILL
jgi:hypothetical protein